MKWRGNFSFNFLEEIIYKGGKMEKIFCEKIKKEIDRTECVKCKYYEDGSKHYLSKGCYYIIRTHRADIDTVIKLRKKRYDYFMEIAEKNYKINRPKIAQEFEIKAYYVLDEISKLKKEKAEGNKYAVM